MPRGSSASQINNRNFVAALHGSQLIRTYIEYVRKERLPREAGSAVPEVVSDAKRCLELMVISQYLSGTVLSDSNGQHFQYYYDKDLEGIARGLLASLLRSDAPISRAMRDQLAELISPQKGNMPHSEREFVIQYRSAGNRKDLIRDYQVCDEIAAHLNHGGIMKNALKDVMKKHNLKRTQILEIWREYREIYALAGWLKERI